MSEEKTLTLYQQQKATKPSIEDIIAEIIPDGDVKKAVLDLAAYLRANKMSLRWYGGNEWTAINKGKRICRIALGNIWWSGKCSNYWHVNLKLTKMSEYEESAMNAGMQKIIWDNIKYCNNCSGCAPGREMTISGREFKGICHDMFLIIFDPDEATVDGIKRLLELEKKARADTIK